MAAPKRGPRLGAGPAHQKLMLSNLASDLFRHGRITTTHAKAKTLRPYAEKLITKAKAGDLHSRRQVLSKLRDREVVAYLFEDVAPRVADRNGGYTRILKLGPRAGDAAPMALIELVDRAAESGDEVIEEAKQSRRGLFGRRRRRAQPEPAAAGAYDFGADDELEENTGDDSSSDDSSSSDASSSESSSDAGAEAAAGAEDSGDEPVEDPAAEEEAALDAQDDVDAEPVPEPAAEEEASRQALDEDRQQER